MGDDRIPVTADESGIIRVFHELDTMELQVKCETADGARVGYLAANPISRAEVEVVPVPGGPDIAVVVVSPAGS